VKKQFIFSEMFISQWVNYDENVTYPIISIENYKDLIEIFVAYILFCDEFKYDVRVRTFTKKYLNRFINLDKNAWQSTTFQFILFATFSLFSLQLAAKYTI